MCYISRLPYCSDRVHAAALYCSDGRVGEHFDDFVQNGLSLPRYDRVALPGGPACLAGYAQARLEEEGVIDELKFLIESHALSKVVLIQHEGCAFYASRLKARQESVEQLQIADLARAAYSIRHWTSLVDIEGYYLRLRPEGVLFERVPLT
ncbi:MAG: carbonic anhydrase [Tepidisphaeraceae bacterium]